MGGLPAHQGLLVHRALPAHHGLPVLPAPQRVLAPQHEALELRRTRRTDPTKLPQMTTRVVTQMVRNQQAVSRRRALVLTKPTTLQRISRGASRIVNANSIVGLPHLGF